MQEIQRQIAHALNVRPAFTQDADVEQEIERRISFIQQCLQTAGMKTLVLGISGGVDSLTAGLLAQRAVAQLRQKTEDDRYRFIAVRLPYGVQHDEDDAQLSLDVIRPDEIQTIDIAPAVKALAAQTLVLREVSADKADFVLGNVKARIRMVAQYTIANARDGLVIGTDHAAEAVMGFFTKFGDGACDLAPLSGLVKRQVRAIAAFLGAPEQLVKKTPTADLEELRPGRPDEDAYGVSYDQIDAFLLGQPVDADASKIICDTYARSAHKRGKPKAP